MSLLSSRAIIVSAAVSVGFVGHSQAELIYGITNLQQLVAFDSGARTVLSTTSLPGFGVGGEQILSIDIRPATQELYGLSSFDRIYKITPSTGATTLVGSGTLSVALTGNSRAIDFNPTVDRIRVLTSAQQNLRVHPDTGAVVDFDAVTPGTQTDLNHNYAAGDAGAGTTPQVVNGAYTNSFAGAGTTTLYTLESARDVLATQVPPNNGTLNSVGALGFNVVESAGFTGFDISGGTGVAYLTGNSLTGGLTANSLYSVNLGTGAAGLLGAVSGVNGTFRDIAVVPEPASIGAMLAGGMLLIRRRK